MVVNIWAKSINIKKTMWIHIKNLRLRAIIGLNDWERTNKQEVVINVEIEFDGSQVSQSDNIEDTVNYRSVSKRIIAEVEQTNFQMLEKLAAHVLSLVAADSRVTFARVEVDKPRSLRFADSVSVVTSERRG